MHKPAFALLLTAMFSACSSAPPSQIFIDAAKGLETNSGSQDQPLKTIKTALQKATSGSAKTIVLLAGTYDGASGETWGYSVPDGITLKANSAGVILAGIQGKSAFTLLGSPTLSFLTLRGFDVAVQAASGSPTLNGVVFESNKQALKLSGSAQATLNDVTFSGSVAFSPGDTLAAMQLSETAQATLNNPILGDTYSSYIKNQAKVVLNGGSGSGLGSSVFRMSNSASLTCQGFSAQNILGGQTLLQMGENTSAELNKCTYQLQSGQPYGEIADLRNSARLRMQDVSVYGDVRVFVVDASARVDIIGGGLAVLYSSGILNVSGSRLNQLIVSGGTTNVTDSSISNSSDNPAVYVGGGQLKIRGSKISGSSSSSGLLVSNTNGVQPPDLGTLTDPGNNDFSGSAGVGLEINAPVQVPAAGNKWKPNLQGADASGRYATQTIAGPQGNRTKDFNYFILNGSSIRF